MAFDEDRQAEAIAAEWGVNVNLLEETDWNLEAIDGNDGEVYGYRVRFDDETDPEILAELGLRPGELTRQLSINAFDEPDYTDEDYDRDLRIRAGIEGRAEAADPDDEVFSIDEPLPDIPDANDDEHDGSQFPDLPPGQAYLTDKEGRVLTDKLGRPLIVDALPSSGALGGAPLSEYVINGPTYAGRSFAGHSFATDNGDRIVDNSGNRLVFDPMPAFDQNAVYQQELQTRIGRLEAALEAYSTHLPPRNHNHPPELVEPDPIAPADFKIVLEVVIELKVDAQEEMPDPVRLEAKASLFRRVAGAIAAWCGRKADAAVDAAIQWAIPAGIVWAAANPQEVQAALQAVADAASSWAKYLTAIAT
ncbi:hypothetical protein QA644_27860 (plasmid) [Rhizobium sp. CC1099]|uniref:hypothetical protein n=1 Tax=Rhizobium sp. CC1099 TaxID=3039160 RepID=UPI0024B0F604|nr:hypothetical protein [Rhizobium sp. CC1099]WFU89865.1 hypothetical protein QA644_27860 [Rhizobium sp. CC1099]